jgi:cobalt-zinc-cadmium efflux system membrane fusion protein
MTSPFNGEVLEKHMVLGEALESQANAFIIADLDSVWVDVRVFEKDLPHIQPGQTVQISGPEGYAAVEGAITYVAPVVDRETRTALARIVLPNTDRRWRPGLFLRVRLRLEQTEAAVLIPKTAVQRFERTVHCGRWNWNWAVKAATASRWWRDCRRAHAMSRKAPSN